MNDKGIGQPPVQILPPQPIFQENSVFRKPFRHKKRWNLPACAARHYF
jgi:hypothetical protein